ncbi:MAG TPA: hypothetical protein VKH45_11260 [Candidatus Acidoferrum sp.]|nr:hypothetical protein [Candidatus Acidoferrum sp.]
MMGNRKIAIFAVILGVGGILVGGRIAFRHYRKTRPTSFSGAVIRQDNDPRKQSPVANVEISSLDGWIVRDVKSDFSGSFKLALRPGVKIGQTIHLVFRHPDFQPLDLTETLGDKLYVIRMTPLHDEVEAKLNEAEVVIGNIVVRYSTETTKTENIGSAVKTFQVVNTGNVPCSQHQPCSPDGKWKAEEAAASLDAGEGNVFRDARVTCIAGPCPFTRIDTDEFSRGGRSIKVSVRDWSDSTTFLFQAEVFRSQLDVIIRRTYPVIFGRAMNFTLPSTAEGPSIEAELNRGLIVFPLGPSPVLSWAHCQVRVEKNQARDYRCELKAGYRFK